MPSYAWSTVCKSFSVFIYCCVQNACRVKAFCFSCLQWWRTKQPLVSLGSQSNMSNGIQHRGFQVLMTPSSPPTQKHRADFMLRRELPFWILDFGHLWTYWTRTSCQADRLLSSITFHKLAWQQAHLVLIPPHENHHFQRAWPLWLSLVIWHSGPYSKLLVIALTHLVNVCFENGR